MMRSRWRAIRSLEDRERVVSRVVDRLRADVRVSIAAALELEGIEPALARVASLDRVAAILEAHEELEAFAFLYAIAHECSARRADARQARFVGARARHTACEFPPFPSETPRAPAARVSRPVQQSLGLGGATAAPQSPCSETEQPARLAPWQRPRRAL